MKRKAEVICDASSVARGLASLDDGVVVAAVLVAVPRRDGVVVAVEGVDVAVSVEIAVVVSDVLLPPPALALGVSCAGSPK